MKYIKIDKWQYNKLLRLTDNISHLRWKLDVLVNIKQELKSWNHFYLSDRIHYLIEDLDFEISSKQEELEKLFDEIEWNG